MPSDSQPAKCWNCVDASCSLPHLLRPAPCSATPAAVAGKAAAPAPAAKAAAAPSAKATAAGSAAGQLDRQSSGGGAASMEDGDLFKTTDRQRAGIKDAVPSVRKVRGHWLVLKAAPAQQPTQSGARGTILTAPRAVLLHACLPSLLHACGCLPRCVLDSPCARLATHRRSTIAPLPTISLTCQNPAHAALPSSTCRRSPSRR